MSCEEFTMLIERISNDIKVLQNDVDKKKYNTKEGESSQVTVDINYLKRSLKEVTKAARDCEARGM